MPLHFYERPALVPVFINWKISEEDFPFYKKKGEKWKQHLVVVLQQDIKEAEQRDWHQAPSTLRTVASS